jgi:hypothetical protein
MASPYGLALLAVLLAAFTEPLLGNPEDLQSHMSLVKSVSPSQRALYAARLRQAAADANASQAIGCVLQYTGGLYAKDPYGFGQIYMFQPNATSIYLYTQVNNLTGVMPPFTSYIRILDGLYKYRIVLGPPTFYWIHVPGSYTYEQFLIWDETDLFPRAPGWTMQQYFNDFLLKAPQEFFIAVHTVKYIKGALRCTLQYEHSPPPPSPPSPPLVPPPPTTLSG